MLRDLSDDALLAALRELSLHDSDLEADLLLHLAEVDVRELYLGRGHASLFSYCTEVLHYSESCAYHRIAAARAARSFPRVIDMVRGGELHLAGIRHKSKRSIEAMLADWAPKPDAPAVVRLLPQARPIVAPPRAAAPSTVPGASCVSPVAPPAPLGAGRFKVTFTASAQTHAKLEEARSLLRHQIPDGDLAALFDRALDSLLRALRSAKFAETETPRSAPRAQHTGSRHIPAAIRRAVAERDQRSCTFVAVDGTRCGSREALEFHHLEPFARARRHRLEEITLRCRAHNRYAAIRDYGVGHMARFRK